LIRLLLLGVVINDSGNLGSNLGTDLKEKV